MKGLRKTPQVKLSFRKFFNRMGGPWVGWAGPRFDSPWVGSVEIWQPTYGWAETRFDSLWVAFLRPSPAHSELWYAWFKKIFIQMKKGREPRIISVLLTSADSTQELEWVLRRSLPMFPRETRGNDTVCLI
jgi:hypothetical protein